MIVAGHHNIEFVFEGLVITGLRNVTLEVADSSALTYGNGSLPYGKVQGVKDYSFSVELQPSDVDAIVKQIRTISPNADITDLENISMTVLVKTGASIQKHVLSGGFVQNHGFTSSAGSTDPIGRTISGKAMNIIFNAA